MKIQPKNVIELLRNLPPTQAVLIRGPHGIGKSQICAALGAMTNRPVIDRRLAQLSEGDFTGLPKLYDHTYDNDGKIVKYGRTEFMPPEWFVSVCNEPHVLLLDELNRATPEIQQCAFELVLDRALQGRRIHPDTTVVAAVNGSNSSAQYQVNDLDPALLDRFLVVDMIPEITDWKEWAQRAKLDQLLIDFCVENPNHWWFDPSTGGGLEPNKVYPTPRSWAKLDEALKHGKFYDNPGSPIVGFIATGLVGSEAGIAFASFIRDTSRMISADDIVNKYDSPRAGIRKRVKNGSMSAEQQLQVIDRLVTHIQKNVWTEVQTECVRKFFDDIANGEIFFAFWTKISGPISRDIDPAERKLRTDNQKTVHRKFRDMIMSVGTSGTSSRS